MPALLVCGSDGGAPADRVWFVLWHWRRDNARPHAAASLQGCVQTAHRRQRTVHRPNHLRHQRRQLHATLQGQAALRLARNTRQYPGRLRAGKATPKEDVSKTAASRPIKKNFHSIKFCDWSTHDRFGNSRIGSGLSGMIPPGRVFEICNGKTSLARSIFRTDLLTWPEP